MNKKVIVFMAVILVLLSSCSTSPNCRTSQCTCGREEKSYTVYLDTGEKFPILASDMYISLERGTIFFDEECDAVAYFSMETYFVENEIK